MELFEKIPDDLWRHLLCFLDTPDRCTLWGAYPCPWMRVHYVNAVHSMLNSIPRPPICIVKNCLSPIEIKDIHSYYCGMHDTYETVVDVYSSPWYFRSY